MKKITLQFIIFIMLIAGGANAQNLIAVQNGGSPSFYSKLDSAIVHAQNGDTIYIPGGNHTITQTINKCIHIVGTGYHPDSTVALPMTIINGCNQIILNSDASFGSITGIYFDFTVGYSCPQYNIVTTNPVTNFYISRCYLSNGISGSFTNSVISENFTRKLSIYNSNNSISNNIILGPESQINESLIKNNIFCENSQYYYALYPVNCIIENNIFKPGYAYSGGGNIFHNNVNGGINGTGSNFGSGNYFDNLPLYEIFNNYDPPIPWNQWDLNLSPGSPYSNAGTDGTDIGIYGGAFPWKCSGIPFNPHVQFKNISGTTNNEGNLNVNIKVSAQDR